MTQGKRATYNMKQARESKEWQLYWKIKFSKSCYGIPEKPRYIYNRCARLLRTERFINKLS